MSRASEDVIFFRCPECGEEMEINARREGEEVRCVECGEIVLVRSQAPRRSGRSVRRREDPGLSSSEWWMFGILFFFIPAVNVFASSILYYIWKADKPRRAGQINMLGFLVFGIHILLFVGLFIVIITISPAGPPRRQF